MTKEELLICGIDPGLTNTGWGIITTKENAINYVASGVITTKSDLTIEKRLKIIHEELAKIFNLYQPNQYAIEDIFVNSNNVSSLKLGYARGAAILTIALAQKEFFEYAPNLVKKAVVGRGKATKEQVQFMVNKILPKAKETNEHAVDALAIAICHANYKRY
jgi:crossover junction endodeoxyribonuclease RuvC